MKATDATNNAASGEKTMEGHEVLPSGRQGLPVGGQGAKDIVPPGTKNFSALRFEIAFKARAKAMSTIPQYARVTLRRLKKENR